MKLKSMRPIVAASAIRELFANPDDTQHVFEIIEELQGPSLVRLRARLQTSEQGRQLLAVRRDLGLDRTVQYQPVRSYEVDMSLVA